MNLRFTIYDLRFWKAYIGLFAFLIFPVIAFSQKTPPPVKPKLVVGIIVDQMRYDYISRYWNKFGEGGFKKLVNEGFFCKNTNYTYVPTYTGPGHSSVFTGATPSVHGIVGNNWYSREEKRMVYCSEDKSVKTLGSASKAGLMSPKNLCSTTIGDELKIATHQKSKVIGIALKDRGAILPAGHSANAAYWFDDSNGAWISSTYYFKELPTWVNEFNKLDLAKKYLAEDWATLLPIEKYTESIEDDNPYESKFNGEAHPVFPHRIPQLMKYNGNTSIIRNTPSGNSITKDFAIEALKKEGLGKHEVTDFLSVSFSSTDYVGHAFGPLSVEVEDTYLRLDKDIAEFVKALDSEVGKGNYLLFLTADHGAVINPSYLAANHIPAGSFNDSLMEDTLKKFLQKKYGDTLVVGSINQQIYLDHQAIDAKKLNLDQVKKDVILMIANMGGVSDAMDCLALQSGETSSTRGFTKNGFLPSRSGDVAFTLSPGWTEWERTGTTHGSPYPYDTHVPLLWFGGMIKNGSSEEPVSISDIAPTVSFILDISPPNGSFGKVLFAPMK